MQEDCIEECAEGGGGGGKGVDGVSGLDAVGLEVVCCEEGAFWELGSGLHVIVHGYCCCGCRCCV